MSDNPQSGTETTPQANGGSTPLVEAIGVGVTAGMIAGVAAHFLGGGKLTFPIFIGVYFFFMLGLKGWGKLTALATLAITGGAVAALLQYLK